MTARCGALDDPAGQLLGRNASDPVDQLVRLVDDDDVVLRQHVDLTQRIDREQRVIRDDDIGAHRSHPRRLSETVCAVRTIGGAKTLARRDGDLTPRPLADTGQQLVAVAGIGGVRPFGDAHDVTTERRCRPGGA